MEAQDHPDHDARCVSGGRAARCSQGVPIEECYVHTPFGDGRSTVAVAFEPAGPSSTPPAWSNSGESVQASTTCGDRRRRSCCLRIFAWPAIIVETAVGPLLTFPGAVQEKVAVDIGIEFPDDLMPEPAEEDSLDEALKARAPSLLCSAPGESLDTAKELSIKFDAKEDAEIPQADAAGRERRRQGEVPRSLPLKTSSRYLV